MRWLSYLFGSENSLTADADYETDDHYPALMLYRRRSSWKLMIEKLSVPALGQQIAQNHFAVVDGLLGATTSAAMRSEILQLQQVTKIIHAIANCALYHQA